MTNSAPSPGPRVLRPSGPDRRQRTGRPRRPGHLLGPALLAGGLGLGAVLAATSVAGAQSSGGSVVTTPATAPVAAPVTARVPTTLQPMAAPTPNIIPMPNSGHPPRDAGERGGAWQEGLFFLMCGAVLGIGGLIWRDSRKKRRKQGRLPAKSSRSPADPVA